jgi:hypothetical protein
MGRKTFFKHKNEKNKKSPESNYIEKIVKCFVEYTLLCVVVLILISIILLFIGAYSYEINPLISTAFTSVGSALFGIGCISLVFRSASSYLMERVQLKKAVENTIKRMYHTYIPIITVKESKIEITITADESNEYLFSWDRATKVDPEKLKRFLRYYFDIDWVEDVRFSEPNGDLIISSSNDENSARIMMDEEEKKAILAISDGRTYDLKVKNENGKPNINHDCPKMVISEYTSLVNNLERTLTQKKVSTELPTGQTFKMIRDKIHLKGKSFELTEDEIKINHTRVTDEEGKKVIGERYGYILPFNAPLGQGEGITIEQEYEWTPCKALPGTDESDCFNLYLEFPTEKLQITLKADKEFYFKDVTKQVIGWGGEITPVNSAPTQMSISDDGKLTEYQWELKEEELSHKTEYEIRFKLNKLKEKPS